jgi:ATP-dependent exoDNAse (exonuclease V) beta subunit
MNKPQIISVQASAGSGKTYNLAKRYIYLLLGSNNETSIKNIIAVTFTNKAAVEMKYRVLDYLKKAALCLDTGDFFDDLNLTKTEISKKSIATLEDILRFYDNFNIGTIDSFKNHILKSCAISIDLSPNFTIEQDYSDNLLFSLENFLQKARYSENLRNLLLQYVSQYTMKDSGWIPKDNIYRETEKIFKKSGNTGKNILTGNRESFDSEASSRVKMITDKIKIFAKLLPKLKINSHHIKAVDKVLKNDNKIFFEVDNIPKRFSSESLEYNKDAIHNPEADELWEAISKDIKSFCDFYINNYYNIYSNIYSQVAIEFDKQSRKDGVVFLNEINKKTVNFFEKNEAVMPEVYYRLSEKYKHFLIDEFQDTSLVQWAGIKRFLEESLAVNGTFFYVGDVKQAIYAFRGGNSELFDTMSNEFPSANIDKQYLKKNFRSGKVVVDFNNHIFSKENIERFLDELYEDEDAKCDFSKFVETYNFSEQESIQEHNYGYVEIDVIDKTFEDVNEETKQKFMNHISHLIERFDLQNIAVLCRSNDEIPTVSSWLLEKGFEIESSQTLNIKNNNVIKQIVSLLMFINSPIDALSFSSFVLGDVFSKASSFESTEFEKFIFTYNKENKSGIFYKNFRYKYETLWNEYFEEFFVKAGFVPVYELTLSILEKFKIIDNSPGSKAFVMCFLELIKDFEMQDSGLKNFLEYFNKLRDDKDSLYIKNAFGSGIKIMTAHKAKGLQFPVVIMPFFKLSEHNMDRPYFDSSNEEIKLLNISQNLAKFSEKAKKIYDREKLNLLLSELNVLYVCMTRAEYEFYAIVPPKSGVASNKALVLLGSGNLISGVQQKYAINNAVKGEVVLDNFDTNYKDIQKYLMNDKKTTIDINDIKRRGTILHYALSKIVSLKNKNRGDAIADVVNITKRKFLFEDIDFVKEKLEGMFKSEEILKLFMYDETKIYNEKEIINAFGDSFRIDKLIVDDNEIVVVDFKSSNYNKIENKEQLKNYAVLISEIYLHKKIVIYIVDIEKGQLNILQ